jgi:ubiquinone biosynthesis protein
MLVQLIRIPYLVLLGSWFILYKIVGGHPDLSKMLQRFGPSFVKLGQALSVRPDIIGPELAKKLSQLQDNMRPFPTYLVERIIKKELGASVDELFLDFNPIPVAAASIAQVHQVVLQDGTKVAVKILRPHIGRSFKRDLALFRFIASGIEIIPAWRRLKAKEVVGMFAGIVRKELDLRLEAAAAAELAANLKNDKGIHIPAIYWRYTTRRVLVMEWVDGVPIHDIPALQQEQHDLPALAKNMYLHFLNQAYRDGFFHADIHPGNVFVTKDSIITLVDFGIMARLSEETRYFVAEILRGFITQDYGHVAKIHFMAGYVPNDQDIGDFTLALRTVGEPIINLPAKDISLAKLLGLLFKITADFNMQTQPQLLLLQKTLVLVEGICKQLDPDINLWAVARPWMEEWAKKNLGLRASLARKRQVIQALLWNLPERLQRMSAMLAAPARFSQPRFSGLTISLFVALAFLAGVLYSVL